MIKPYHTFYSCSLRHQEKLKSHTLLQNKTSNGLSNCKFTHSPLQQVG